MLEHPLPRRSFLNKETPSLSILGEVLGHAIASCLLAALFVLLIPHLIQ